jgi:ATP-binding cassette subfamily F protein uup
VIKDFSIKITRNSRIGLVGPNGAGKTTLINMLTGILEPDEGSIRQGANIEMASLDQKRAILQDDWVLSDALTQGGGDMVEVNGQSKHVIAYMKDFLFSPEQVKTPVRVLSGGEKARLMLARAMALPSNLLVLDEPTNDLDLETLDLLQSMISEYKGTVFLVSHDRDFLDRICTSVLVSDGDGEWLEYAGGYQDMVAQRGANMKAREKTTVGSLKAPIQNALSSPQATKKKRMANKDKYALKLLPGEIEKLSELIETLEKELSDPKIYQDTKRFESVSSKMAQANKERDTKEERWLELEALKEELEGG